MIADTFHEENKESSMATPSSGLLEKRRQLRYELAGGGIVIGGGGWMEI